MKKFTALVYKIKEKTLTNPFTENRVGIIQHEKDHTVESMGKDFLMFSDNPKLYLWLWNTGLIAAADNFLGGDIYEGDIITTAQGNVYLVKLNNPLRIDFYVWVINKKTWELYMENCIYPKEVIRERWGNIFESQRNIDIRFKGKILDYKKKIKAAQKLFLC